MEQTSLFITGEEECRRGSALRIRPALLPLNIKASKEFHLFNVELTPSHNTLEQKC